MPSQNEHNRLRYLHLRDQERSLLVAHSLKTRDIGEVAEIFKTTPQRVRYWVEKFFSPSFHSQRHGGFRHQKFDNVTQSLIHAALWDLLERFPLGTIRFFVKKLRKLKFAVVYSDVRKIFNSWNWSWKIPGVQQLHKYTPSNVEYYFTFAVGIRFLPLIHLKWLDEAHIMPSHLLKGHHVWGPRNERSIIINSASSLSSSFSLTALMTLDESHPIVLDLRTDTNTQFDFLRFMLYLLKNNHLKEGDYFLMDSARIHGADATWEIVNGLLKSRNIQLIWLPKYSPEFNPVELFWRYLKENLRHLPSINDFTFLQNKIIDITARCSMDYILGWYFEAITKWEGQKYQKQKKK